MKFLGAICLLNVGLITTWATPTGAVSNFIANGQIISLTGEVHLKRESGETFTATVGTRLYPGDELITLSSGEVVVQCADLTFQSIQRNQFNGCGDIAASDECNPGVRSCPRRGDKVIPLEKKATPYLISPRHTKLLNPQPTLRWQAVPEAHNYTVTLEAEGKIVWEAEVSDTQVVYSGEQSLQPGQEYSITIKTDTGKFYVSPLIQVLDEVTAKQVREAEAVIKAKSLDGVSKAIAIANVYLENGLHSEALLLLEEAVIGKVQTASLYQQLGDVYFYEQLLVPEAKVYYLQALELVNPDNLVAQAAIQDSLGQVYISLNDIENARHLLTAALKDYEALGNSEKVKSLEVQLKMLDEQFQ